MCGRFVLASKHKIKNKYNFKIEENYNITPGSYILIIDNNFLALKIKWGYFPNWIKNLNMINARIETLFKKSVYKNSLRCIILADGYYEWKKENSIKQPYYFYLKDRLLYFAGIYNLNSGCCIVTTKSQQGLSHVHDRQPLILKENSIKDWLDFKYNSEFKISEPLCYHKVNTIVNSPSNNSKLNLRKHSSAKY